MAENPGEERRSGLAELAEDAVGFGGQEIRLTRDLIVRPRAVLDAYDNHGPTAGGLYPRPLRYFLALNGVYLLLIALLGGFERTMDTLPQSALENLARGAGKSLDAFHADMDQWFSLLSVPIIAVFMAGVLFLLFRRWSPKDDRADFRQTFTFMSGWTLYGAPLGLLGLVFPELSMIVIPGSLLLVVLLWARMGPGRWWRTTAGAWGRGLVLTLVMLIVQIPASVLLWVLAVAAARFLP
jgi:hypothetical protein